MNQPHRRLADLTSQELLRRAAEYRRMAIMAHGQATILALNKLAIRFALLAARREIDEVSHLSHPENAVPDQDRSELDKLIHLAEQAAANEADPVKALAAIIRIIAEGDADPYLVMGVLVEGAVHTLATRIPAVRLDDTAAALSQLLEDRLKEAGLLGGA